jgi:RnfABCDGE-type electron transport complex B subunit
MGGLGLFFATVLAFASEKLKVKEDPRVLQVNEALPGLNCGACGQAGCHDLAEKIVAQGSLENLRCPPGGSEVEEKISEILGIAAAPAICVAAQMVGGGSKACTYGCSGLGDCVRVCPFDAIKMGEDDLPKVIEDKCTACGLCVEACPRDIIELVSCENRIIVNCNSKDKGAMVRKVCKVGCIACNICLKNAPEGYTIKDNLARVNYKKGDDSAEPAVQKCPTKCIIKL